MREPSPPHVSQILGRGYNRYEEEDTQDSLRFFTIIYHEKQDMILTESSDKEAVFATKTILE